mgnify:CR=1 FL=1
MCFEEAGCEFLLGVSGDVASEGHGSEEGRGDAIVDVDETFELIGGESEHY